MNTLKLTSQFKKDLKRYKHNPEAIGKLEHVLKLLVNNLPIPEDNRPHMLTGNYGGYMECHVESARFLSGGIRAPESSNLCALALTLNYSKSLVIRKLVNPCYR